MQLLSGKFPPDAVDDAVQHGGGAVYDAGAHTVLRAFADQVFRGLKGNGRELAARRERASRETLTPGSRRSAAYGKNDKKMQNQLFKYAITAVTLISIVIYAVVLLFANPITSVFNGEGNMQLQAIAVKGMYLYFTSILFIGMNIVMATYFAAREKVIPSYIISFGRGFVVIIQWRL